MSDIGATSPGRWQVTHLLYRIGATSLLNVGALCIGGTRVSCAAPTSTSDITTADVKTIARISISLLSRPEGLHYRYGGCRPSGLPSLALQFTPNARRTFPARPPNAPYPEFTNNMPPEIAGPGPIIDAPWPLTPLTVSNSRFESNSQITVPSLVEYARRAPSFDPEKIAPGMTVSAAD